MGFPAMSTDQCSMSKGRETHEFQAAPSGPLISVTWLLQTQSANKEGCVREEALSSAACTTRI